MTLCSVLVLATSVLIVDCLLQVTNQVSSSSTRNLGSLLSVPGTATVALTVPGTASAAEEKARAANRLVLKKASQLEQDERSYVVKDDRAGHTFSEEFNLQRELACQGLITDHTRPLPPPKCNASSLLGTLRTRLRSGGHGAAHVFLEHGEVLDKICARPPGLPHFDGQCIQGLARDELAELLKLTVSSPGLQGSPSCAVVGSSGNVLGSQMGAAVDSHDVVVRFGCAPTEGFKVDVGQKTTHRFLYPEAMVASGPHGGPSPCGGVVDWSAEGSIALVRMYKPSDIFWWTDLLEGKDWHQELPRLAGIPRFWREVPETKNSGIRPPTTVLNPQWMAAAANEAGLAANSVPSQGMVGILFALSTCRTVDIYGFGTETALGTQLDLAHAHYFE